MSKLLIPELTGFLISSISFLIGARYLSSKKTPMYFRLFFYASGCYMLEEIWVVTNLLFGDPSTLQPITVRLLGIFGYFEFLVSANRREIDRLVDEGIGGNRQKRLLTFLVPMLCSIPYLYFFFSSVNPFSTVQRIIVVVCCIPSVTATYFCAKHLLLPADALGFLKLIRPTDIAILFVCVLNVAYVLLQQFARWTFLRVLDILFAVSTLLIAVLSVREAKKWNTLI